MIAHYIMQIMEGGETMPVTRTRTIRKSGVTLKIKTTTPTQHEIRRELEKAVKKAAKQ